MLNDRNTDTIYFSSLNLSSKILLWPHLQESKFTSPKYFTVYPTEITK